MLFVINNSLIHIIKKDHLFEVENSEGFVYLLFYLALK